MVRVAGSIHGQVEDLYTRRGDVAFAELLDLFAAEDDAELADLIDADGRARVRRGLSVELTRYLDSVVNLTARIEALDAAIDAALRSETARGAAAEQAVDSLVASYPRLEVPIREAAALSRAILSTSSLHRALSTPAPPRVVPGGFGPRLADGRFRYELTTLLGRGSGGEVYKAIDRLMSEPAHEALVAVKLLSSREDDPWARRRFVEEATKARRVVHPNVVRVIDRGASDEGEDFIVYEYVAGGDLQAYAIRHDPLTEAEAVRLVAGIARGVQAAHAAGLVHCDLKPSNIVVTEQAEARIADFGVAVRHRSWERREARPSDSGPVGNLAFIAPEQYRMEPGALAPPADVYAIGGIMHWLLTRRLPNGETIEEIDRVHNVKGGRLHPPRVRDARSRIDPQLDAVCARCLESDPACRYGSAAQLAEDLELWQQHQPIRWTNPSLTHRFRLWLIRSPGVAAALGLLLIVMAAAVAAVWRLASLAERRRYDAANAAKEVAAIEKWRGESQATIRMFWDMTRAITSREDSWQLLPIMPYMEWAFHASRPDDAAPAPFPWADDRIASVRALLGKSRASAGDDDLQSMALEFTLAFLLIRNGEIDEGAAMARANRERWRALLPADDRWLVWIEGMIAAADVRHIGIRQELTTRTAELAEAERALIAAWSSLGEGPTESPLRELLRDALATLYGPGLLNDPRKAAQYRE